jgi:hypothetical protein
MLIESVKGEIIRVPQIKEIAQARRHGNLQPGSYMHLLRTDKDDKAVYQLQDYGDAETLLSKQFITENAARLERVVPSGIGGWLGRLRASVTETRGPEYTTSRTR